jgi:hypothetical protein
LPGRAKGLLQGVPTSFHTEWFQKLLGLEVP